MIPKSHALVVLSGGQDSTTCLFWAKRYFDRVHAVTFNYNQRHHIEIKAARNVARIAGVSTHEIVSLGPILKGTSPLTNSEERLEAYEYFAAMDAIIGSRVEKTFVPMRNALFLTLAANRAVVMGIDNIVTGVCQADNANYPDCRQSFIDSQTATINAALGVGHLKIHTPLMNMTKALSIHLACQLGGYTALAYSHTAYDGLYPPTGKDHASLLRAQGFLSSGLPDPLVVRAVMDGQMELPVTPNYSDKGKVDEVMRSIADIAVYLSGLTPS